MLYERRGVREYWVGDVSPIASRALGGFIVDPVELFGDLD
jgi:hypothetical protein